MFTIYKAFGATISPKVGCTQDFERRKSQYPKGTKFKVLEEIEGSSTKAAKAERHWQRRLRVRSDGWPYKLALSNARRGVTGLQTMSSEDKARYGRLGGRIAAKSPRHISNRKVRCTWCREVGGMRIMQRWHFDRCKEKRV